MPRAIMLLPGRRRPGRDRGRRRARVHERAGERARLRVALDHLRRPPGRRRLAGRRGRPRRRGSRAEIQAAPAGRYLSARSTRRVLCESASSSRPSSPRSRSPPRRVAAPPSVHARAYFIENASTGETIAAYARPRAPADGEHHEADDGAADARAREARRDASPSAPATEVGGSSIYLHPGDRLTVRDLVEGALIQSANDAAVALADYVGHGDRARFVAMMNATARAARARATRTSRAPTASTRPATYSSARDLTQLGAGRDATSRSCATTVAHAHGDDRRRPASAHLERPARRRSRA